MRVTGSSSSSWCSALALLCWAWVAVASGQSPLGTTVATSAGSPSVSSADPAPAGFHAEGHAPYWTLDIDPAAAAVTWGLLGAEDLTLDYAPPLPADARTETRFYFRGVQRLKATLTEVPCRDAETGNAYAYGIIVEVGGQRYEGCANRTE